MICGQRYTSRTETLEKFFSRTESRVAVISVEGIRQDQGSVSRLYKRGKLVYESQLRGFDRPRRAKGFLLPASLYFLYYALAFLNALRPFKGKFDFYIGVQTWATLLGISLKRLGKVKSVVYYTVDYYTPKATPESNWQTSLFRHIDRYCCENSDVVWNLAEHFSADRRVAFPGLCLATKEIHVPLTYSESLLTCRNLNEIERHSIAFVGTLEAGQGWEVFIGSIPLVRKRFNDLHVHVFGDGPYRSRITDLIKTERLEDVVTLHGFISDEDNLLKMLSRCAVGVAPYLPHRAEYASLEAGKLKLYAFVGLPIVMTYTAEIESQFKKYGIGLAFRYDSQSLAKAIAHVIEDDKRLKEYKTNASNFAKRFTSEAVLESAYESTRLLLNASPSVQAIRRA